MGVDRNELAENYAALSNDELLAHHSAGTLTNMAYDVLEAELAERRITIPQRPEALDSKHGRPQTLLAHWQGKASLVSAYWLIGVVVSFVFSLLFNLTDSPETVLIFYIAWFPYAVFAMVSIWRCAWNTSWKGWGYIARAQVMLNGVYVFVVFASLLAAL